MSCVWRILWVVTCRHQSSQYRIIHDGQCDQLYLATSHDPRGKEKKTQSRWDVRHPELKSWSPLLRYESGARYRLVLKDLVAMFPTAR